jgi:hypothetical protein
MNTPDDKNLKALGDEVGNLLPETIKGQFRSSVSKIADIRSETNRAFAIILLGCVWAIVIRGRRESELTHSATDSAFTTVLNRLRTLVDAGRIVPISVQWSLVVASIIAPVFIIGSLWLLGFSARQDIYLKPAGESSGFWIHHGPEENPSYGVYSPDGSPNFGPAPERPGWYIITPVLPPPQKPHTE